jgi:hypothetical protein
MSVLAPSGVEPCATLNFAVALLQKDWHALIRGGRNRSMLQQALDFYHLFGGDTEFGMAEKYADVVAAIAEYDGIHGHTPNLAQLRSHAMTVEHDPHTLGKETETLSEHLQQVTEWIEYITHPEAAKDVAEQKLAPEDAEAMFPFFVEMSRKVRDAYYFARFREHLRGGEIWDSALKKKRKATREDAKKLMGHWIAGDMQELSPEPAGKLNENTDITVKTLMDALEPKDKDRLYTGWPLIDENVPIGRAHVRYCAICGATNHGKTPAAFSWAYNMARQGANVLYVTLESPPKGFWIRAFFRYQADHWKEWGHLGHPPTQHRWFADPESVTPEWKQAIEQVAQDIRTGTAMKGTMDFQVLLTYDEMVMHIETTRPDVVFIDFPDMFNTPESGKNYPGEHEAHVNEYLRKLRNLTLSFDEGKGIVIVPLMQIKKTGSGLDAAKKVKPDQFNPLPKRYEDTSCIETYTKGAKAFEFAIALYELSLGTVQCDTIKMREGSGLKPPSFVLTIDPYSRRMYDAAQEWASKPWEEQQAEIGAASRVIRPFRDDIVDDSLGDLPEGY